MKIGALQIAKWHGLYATIFAKFPPTVLGDLGFFLIVPGWHYPLVALQRMDQPVNNRTALVQRA